MLLHFTSLALAAVLGGAPNTALPSNLRVASDSDAVLTVDVLTRMTTFWSNFMKEPDSIRTDGRKTNQEQINMSVGQEQSSTLATNISAMADKYVSVAADLKKAGLTAKQWEAYRLALYSASATKESGHTADSKSVLGKNIAFLSGHDQQLSALKETGMWFPHLQQGDVGSSLGGGLGGEMDGVTSKVGNTIMDKINRRMNSAGSCPGPSS